MRDTPWSSLTRKDKIRMRPKRWKSAPLSYLPMPLVSGRAGGICSYFLTSDEIVTRVLQNWMGLNNYFTLQDWPRCMKLLCSMSPRYPSTVLNSEPSIKSFNSQLLHFINAKWLRNKGITILLQNGTSPFSFHKWDFSYPLTTEWDFTHSPIYSIYIHNPQILLHDHHNCNAIYSPCSKCWGQL